MLTSSMKIAAGCFPMHIMPYFPIRKWKLKQKFCIQNADKYNCPITLAADYRTSKHGDYASTVLEPELLFPVRINLQCWCRETACSRLQLSCLMYKRSKCQYVVICCRRGCCNVSSHCKCNNITYDNERNTLCSKNTIPFEYFDFISSQLCLITLSSRYHYLILFT